jgi:hypothetical protein
MSFEDDEYWDDEYDQYSLVPNAAVVQEKKYDRRTAPDPVIPTRRRDDDEEPVDELAARRVKRATFDAQRPSWLDDPDFVPIDTSRPNLAGDAYDDVDFNRPELGADFDSPEFPISGPRQKDDPYAEFSDYDDDIDQPYDHRDLKAYGHGRTGTVWSSEEEAAAASGPPPRPSRPAPPSDDPPHRQRPRVAEYDYDWSPEDDSRRGPAPDGRRERRPDERVARIDERRGKSGRPDERRRPDTDRVDERRRPDADRVDERRRPDADRVDEQRR